MVVYQIAKISMPILAITEFFAFNEKILYRLSDGCAVELKESDIDVVNELYDQIEDMYPEAFKSLSDIYKSSCANVPYFRFLCVRRFLKCNYGEIDEKRDVVAGQLANLEIVKCPLRGECTVEGIVCKPRFSRSLSAAETRVMKLWFDGADEAEIADAVFLSPVTVHNHIARSYKKLNVHSRAEFVKFAVEHNIFSNG